MRSADEATLLRSLLIILVAYLVIINFNVFVNIILLIIAIVLDGIDGYLAMRDYEKISFIDYIMISISKNKEKKDIIREAKHRSSQNVSYGARLDIAGDRIIEYTIFALFVYLHFLPFYVLLISLFIHSFADALMGSRGTSSKMQTRMARIFYTSNWSRGVANILKILSFSLLIFSYQTRQIIDITYIFTGLLLLFIVLRGLIEIYESIYSKKD